MSDYISREAASADECKHKIKTPFARIVVEGTPEKPCYNILYFDPADGECHIGFGSYCLDNVFNWLAEEFEITEPRVDVGLVRNGRKIEDGDIGGFYLCSLCGECLPYGANYCPSCGAKMDLEDENGN
jgi:hypothetical protein